MHGRGYAWQGACVAEGMCVAGGVHGGGCAWQGAYMAGVGVHGRRIVVGVCMAGGMCGRGHVWQRGMCGRGACMAVGACVAVGACSWGTHAPPSDTTRYGQLAGGTHPTGMHSCFRYMLG